jgi:hypothetical protein
MSRKINYLKDGSSQFVYQLPADNAEKSDLFVSFREVHEDKIVLLKSCELISKDESLNNMIESNTIYLDTVTNKRRNVLKNQTRFLLAPILPKLKEQGIKYVLLFPSVMEAYVKEYGWDEGLKQVGKEFKKSACSNEKLIEKLLGQRRKLAEYYERLGFKSYDPCPGFMSDDWQLSSNEMKTMMNMPIDIIYENSFELIRYENPENGEIISQKLPSQYWMIAKVDDLYKILFTECIKERIKKFKELGAKVFTDLIVKISSLKSKVELVNQIQQQIDLLSVDNFNVEFCKLNQMIEQNKLEIEKLKECMIDEDFFKDLKDLMKFGQKLASGSVSDDGLAKCLNMAKEFEDKDIWILNGGSNTGYYLNSSNNYKRLYLKYKTKYLSSKNN